MDFPDIFRYDDYRPFLLDWFKVHKRRTGRKGTSDFARLAGCTPGHVRNIVTGRRSLQSSFIEGFARALGLSAESAVFFGLLVRHAHPMSAAERLQTGREMKSLQQRHDGVAPAARRGRPRKAPAPAPDIKAAWSEWFHPVIRALACCPGFNENPTWIADSLLPAVSPLQVSSQLRAHPELLRGEDFGITVPSPANNPAFRAYYRQVLKVARWALHNVPSEQRRFRVSTVSLRPDQFGRLRDEMLRYQVEMEELFARAAQGNCLEQVASDEGPSDLPAFTELRHGAPNVVYQLAIQVFPLARMT